MAKFVFPFTTSPVQTEDQWEEVAKGFGIKDGIVKDLYSECAVSPSASGGLAVDVAPGVAVVGGFYYRNDGITTLNLDPAVTADRIDLIVLRRQKSTDDISPYVLKGTEGGGAPTPVDDGDIYDLPLAEVKVTVGATTITAADITDRRTFGKSIVPLVDETLTANAATWTITIPDASIFPVLKVVALLRSTYTGANYDTVNVVPNSDAANTYSTVLKSDGTGASFSGLWRWGSVASDGVADIGVMGVVIARIWHSHITHPIMQGMSIRNITTLAARNFNFAGRYQVVRATITQLDISMTNGNVKAGSRIWIFGAQDIAMLI